MKKMKKKQFSIRNKLVLVFGLLITVTICSLSIVAVLLASKAVTQRIEIQLKKEASYVARSVDSDLKQTIASLQAVARTPMLRNPEISYEQKAKYLVREAAATDGVKRMFIADAVGNKYTEKGMANSIADRNYFKSSIAGKSFVTEPFKGKTSKELVAIISVPLYNENKKIVGIIYAVFDGLVMNKFVEDIKVGDTGYCYVVGNTGTFLAHKDANRVINMENPIEMAKTNKEYKSGGALVERAIKSKKNVIDYYEYKDELNIASFSTIPTTGWTVIIKAPVYEFMGTVDTLRRSMYSISAFVFLAALATGFIFAIRMVKPINVVVAALKDIAQGEGDLTVRLPVTGKDEITRLSKYFNQTIEKLGSSIKIVGEDTASMTAIGVELAGNMNETASAVHEVSANIDGVKQQTLTQAASVTETAATVEEIIRTIRQLNNSIESQSASVSQSSSAVEEMVANIASITQTLIKSDSVVQDLVLATADGKETVVGANAATQKIAEESGSLLDASTVIQHIASQTNLLAMNAAIEAAHAGESGKGFAVVADEIRKLAEESSVQGKNITATLKALSGEIKTLSDSSKIVDEKFGVIFSLTDEVKEMSNNLMAAMHEQEKGSKEVLMAIKDINSITAQVNDGSAEMLKGSEGVAEEMLKLDNLTRAITDSMNEMASGVVQINNGVQEVNQITQQTKDRIESLAEEVAKFKV